MEIGRTPWLLAILTAAWFGWLASRAGRNWVLWAVGGATFGLVAATLVLGLGQAVSIPFSDHERRVDRMEWAAAAAALITIVGWMLTSSLHRHHLVIWRRIKPGSGPTEPMAGQAKPVNTPGTKPSTGRV